MTDEDFLRQSFVSLEVDGEFSQAVLLMSDGSRLCFRHRVGERWAKAEDETTLAGRILSKISLFRLNRKHLDVQFQDGSRWEAGFGDGNV
jgi:hypothetical protein